MSSRENIEEYFKLIYPKFHLKKSLISKEKLRMYRKINYLSLCISRPITELTYIFTLIIAPILFAIDKIFFFKNDYIYNNKNGKSIFLQTVWSFTILIVVIFLYLKNFSTDTYLNKDKISVITSVLLIFFGLYWNARSVFTKKWDYAAEMFNTLCFDLPLRSYEDQIKKNVAISFYQITFNIDLLTIEMWSHESFVYCFKEGVENAILFKKYNEFKQDRKSVDVDLIIQNAIEEINSLYNSKFNFEKSISAPLSFFQEALSDYVTHNNVFIKT